MITAPCAPNAIAAAQRGSLGRSIATCAAKLLFLAGSVLLVPQGDLLAAPPVKATLEKESAWMGEAVPLNITLYSPGPFSGTASFDLPDMPLTAVIRGGSPVVGSESIDGETYFTQQHVLTIYTQRSGKIVIPAFPVRFAGKKTFTTPAEPMQGTTTELSFESKRPPGTENLGIVVAASAMDVTQNWAPNSMSELSAGDVIQRTIVRQASGTTAMMMSPVSDEAPDGIRVYAADPVVQDRSERGTVTAERRDILKYQFEQPGTFTIPDLTIIWWDSGANELQRKTLEGETVSVAGSVAANAETETVASKSFNVARFVSVVIGIGAVAGILGALFLWIRGQRSKPEAVAARNVISACRANDPADAYAAFLRWQQTVVANGNSRRLTELMHGDHAELGGQVDGLTRRLFAGDGGAYVWSGGSLAKALQQTRRSLSRKLPAAETLDLLPDLNPIANPR